MGHVLECTGYEMLIDNIERAEGYHLFDSNGKKYIDFEAGVWCTSLGHNNAEINTVIKNQIDKIIHLGFRYTSQLIEAAAVDVLDTLNFSNGKCLFLSSGSEAVELGVKAAKVISGNKKILTFKETYLSAYGTSCDKQENEWVNFQVSECRKCSNEFNCSKCSYLDEIDFKEIGVFVFEPGNSSGLVLIPPINLVEEISKRIKDNNGLIVVDEVTTGAGRTGKWYGFQHFNFKPDIVALGKGIGNGYPVSVMAVSEHTSKAIEAAGIHHSQSHQNDALGCAIISQVIKSINDNDLINKSHENGQYFIKRLQELKENSNIIKEVRGLGMMIAVEFEDTAKAMLEATMNILVENGYIVGYKPMFNLMRFYPSLITTKEDIDGLVDCITKVLV